MRFKNAIFASALMLSTMLVLTYLSHVEEIPVNKSLSSFPSQIGQWVGNEDRFDSEVYDVLGVDDSFLANYRNPYGRSINLYIGYYQSQKEGDLIHSPRNCMPGAGWNIVATSVEEIQIPQGSPSTIKAIRLMLKNGIHRQIVLYWFQSRGRYISSEYMQKVYLVIDSITRHRTDGSFVRLTAPVVGDEDEATFESLKAFAGHLVPILQEYLPS